MKLNKVYINHLNLVIVITFVTSILIISSFDLSFANKDDENKEDNKDFKKDKSISSIYKTTKQTYKDLKETEVQNDILKGKYPDKFYVCGYPQQVITDYNSFEKTNCN